MTKNEAREAYDWGDPGYQEDVIKALEQKPCEDAVSRQAVLDLVEHYNSDGLGSVFNGYEQGIKFADAVNKLPPVTPQEPILDKISAEIENINLNEVATKYEDRFYGFQQEVIKIIDKYKEESEGKGNDKDK